MYFHIGDITIPYSNISVIYKSDNYTYVELIIPIIGLYDEIKKYTIKTDADSYFNAEGMLAPGMNKENIPVKRFWVNQ